MQGSQKSLHHHMPSHMYVSEDRCRSMVAPEGRREQLRAGGRLFLRLPDSTATWEVPQERKRCLCPVMAASLSELPKAEGCGGRQTAHPHRQGSRLQPRRHRLAMAEDDPATDFRSPRQLHAEERVMGQLGNGKSTSKEPAGIMALSQGSCLAIVRPATRFWQRARASAPSPPRPASSWTACG